MKRIFLLILTLFYSLSTYSADKLSVILDWFPNPDHAPIIIAQQQGFFKEEGLEVELIGPADPNDPPKWVAAGKADIGITYEPQFIEQVDQGLPLIAIGNLIDKPLNCLVALKESGIKTIKDLKGKRIGSSNGGLSSIMLRVMLAHQGLSPTDVDSVNVRYSLTQALLSKKVDAVTGLMRNFEVPQLERMGQNVVTFFPEDYGIPNYSELIFIANINKIKDPRLPKFLKAIKKGVVYLDAHPEATWKAFIKQYPESNNEINYAAWHTTMPYFAEEPSDFDDKEWKNFVNFMLKYKMIRAQQPNQRYFIDLIPTQD